MSDFFEYNTEYGNIIFDVDINHAILLFSGGFDSSVLLYALANALTITNRHSICSIHPILVERIGPRKGLPNLYKMPMLPVATNVIDFVKSKYPLVKINDIYVKELGQWWFPDVFINAQTGAINQLLNKFNINSKYMVYNGVTKNPDYTIANLEIKSGEAYRDTIDIDGSVKNSISVIHGRAFEPFRNGDKLATFALADKLGVLDEMLRLSRSCARFSFQTNNFETTCTHDVCWPCTELDWAKANYVRHDHKLL